MAPDASCRDPRSTGEPAARGPPGPVSPVRRQPVRLREPEASSAERSRVARLVSSLDPLPREPPLVPRFGHRKPSFRLAFTHPRGALDPIALPALRRWPPGHKPPFDFCNWEPHEHTRESSTPRARDGKATACSGSSLPCGPLLAGCFQARGRFPLAALAAPRRSDRSPDGFTPTRSTQTPPVTIPCRTVPGSGPRTDDPAVAVSFERFRPARRACARLAFEGRLARPFAKGTSSAAPGVPSTAGLPSFPESNHSFPAGTPTGSPWYDTFLTRLDASSTGLRRPWLDRPGSGLHCVLLSGSESSRSAPCGFCVWKSS